MRRTAELDKLLEEGRQLYAAVDRDCKNSRLATTFTGGFGDCELVISDPCIRAGDWTNRIGSVLEREGDSSEERLLAVPARGRKSLETDSGYAARCLKQRLAAIEALLPPIPEAAASRPWWRRLRDR